MKKLIIFSLFNMIVFGCAKNIREETSDWDNSTSTSHYYAVIDTALTKVFINENLHLFWNELDSISIFSNTSNRKFVFNGKTGESSGTFYSVSDLDTSGDNLLTGYSYAVYPFSHNNSINTEGTISFISPIVQHYQPKSFGLGSNIMIATTKDYSDHQLLFQNLFGFLKMNLYGDGITIRSITIKGNADERIAGTYNVSIDNWGRISLDSSGAEYNFIELDCGEQGVQIGSDPETAVEFWFAIPPTLFINGFTIIVKDINGRSFIKKTDNFVCIQQNHIVPMSASVLDTVLEYSILEYETDGIEGVITAAGDYFLFKESPEDSIFCFEMGDINQPAQEAAIFNSDGYIQCLLTRHEGGLNNDYNAVSFFYAPSSLLVFSSSGKLISEIPYEEFDEEISTKASALTRNRAFQALKIIDEYFNFNANASGRYKHLKMVNWISNYLMNGERRRDLQICQHVVEVAIDWKNIVAWLELIDFSNEYCFFGNTSLQTRHANIRDFENIDLPCTVSGLLENTNKWKSFLITDYEELVSFAYTLAMDVFDERLSYNAISHQLTQIDKDGEYTFNYSATEIGKTYFYEPHLYLDLACKVDQNAIKNAVVVAPSLPAGYEYPEPVVYHKGCTIYGERKQFTTPSVSSKILNVSNITMTSADVECYFSSVPLGAVCGIEYSSVIRTDKTTINNKEGNHTITLDSAVANVIPTNTTLDAKGE